MSLDETLAKVLEQGKETERGIGFLLEKQQMQLANQQEQIQSLTELLSARETVKQQADGTVFDSVGNRVPKFVYQPADGDTFEPWYERFEQLCLNDAGELTDARKVQLLLSRLGQTEYERFAMSLLPNKPDEFTLEQTVEMLKKKFGRAESVFSVRYKCLTMTKSDAWDVDTFADLVNGRCEQFQFASFTVEDLKCLVFIIGQNSPADAEMRMKLLSLLESSTAAKPCSLWDLVAEAKRLKNLKRDTALVGSSTPPSAVLAVKRESEVKEKEKQSRQSPKAPNGPCWLCGDLHWSRDGSYKDRRCSTCHKMGHRDGYCASAERAERARSMRRVKKEQFAAQTKVLWANGVISQVDSSFDAIDAHRRYVTINVDDKPVTLQLDTASDLTIINSLQWQSIGSPGREEAVKGIRCASLSEIPIIAVIEAEVELQGRREKGTIYISTIESLSVFGLDWINRFDLWHLPIEDFCDPPRVALKIDVDTREMEIVRLKEKFATVFDGAPSTCKEYKVEIPLKEGAQPVRLPYRHVSLKARDVIEEELRHLEAEGVITAVDHSRYSSPIVVVRRSDGRIRIVADYSTDVNAVVEDNMFPIPNPDEILAKVAGARVFSKIDLSNAFLQIPVDERSSEVLTISTHKGLFKVNRLQPGVKCAPGIFQSITTSLAAGIPGVDPFYDDFLVTSPDLPSHIDALEKLLGRLADSGLKVRIGKCELIRERISYLGYVLNAGGIQEDPGKTAAIAALPPPRNVSELRAFLGAVNFYGRFIPQMHELREPFDRLLKKNVSWSWPAECQQAFQRFKDILGSDLAVTHFDPKLPIVVSADASSTGLGAVLAHELPDGTQKTVMYASRSLQPAERGYSQIEKEALALVWAVEKFHRYVKGRRFRLVTDHRPLLAIFGDKAGRKKHTIARLQRWALRLLEYDFEMCFTPTGDFGYVDVLSRLIAESKPEPDEEVIVSCMHFERELEQEAEHVVDGLPITYKTIVEATKVDKALQVVIGLVKGGWPKNEKGLHEHGAIPYFQLKTELSVIGGALFYGERIVIPAALRMDVLDILHRTHPGTDAMKSLARTYVFWPGINQDIKHRSDVCTDCRLAASSPVRTTLRSWPNPTRPMQRLHVDFGHWKGQPFYVIVETFSRYPHATFCRGETSSVAIQELEQFFALFGDAEELVSDNGPAFRSAEFSQFCSRKGIRHLKIPPHHPQSNGRAERFVYSVKNALEKNETNGENAATALREFLKRYRATPNRLNTGGKSPAELFLGRTMNTALTLVRPQFEHSADRNVDQEEQFDRRHGAQLREFERNDEVFAQLYHRGKWHWEPGVVIERKGGVVYVVDLPIKGRLIYSHANQLRSRIAESSPESTESSATIDFEFHRQDESTEDDASDEDMLPLEPPRLYAEVLAEGSAGRPTDGSPGQSAGEVNRNMPPRSTPTPARRYPTRIRRPPARLEDYVLH